MFSHYILVALRVLRRNRSYAILNGLGLTVALACCVLIGLFVRSELSFDDFHKDAGRLMVVGASSWFGSENQIIATPYPLHIALQEEATSVDKAVLTSQGANPATVFRGGNEIGEARTLIASPQFFSTFTFPLVSGDPETVLSNPNGAVITESAAARLFGDEDPVGKVVETDDPNVGDKSLTITGVAEDPARTTTIQPFELVVSTGALLENRRDPDSWGAAMWLTYARLSPGSTINDLEAQMEEMSRVHYPDQEERNEFFALPLPELYLSDLYGGEGFQGNPLLLSLFSIIALFVLSLGVVNYVNLATARAMRRAREVGVRKTLGAGRREIARQFLAEAVVLTVLSAAAALVVAVLVLPAFNAAFGTKLARTELDIGFIAAVLAFAAVVGLLAGTYPSFVLTRFDPARVLQGVPGRSGKPARGVLRQGLVAFQFAVAIALLIGTAVVYRQLGYAAQEDFGFRDEHLIALDLGSRSQAVPWQPALDAVRQSPFVEEAVAATGYPGVLGMRFGNSPDPDQEELLVMYAAAKAEPGYPELLGLEVIAGSTLDDPRKKEILINEALLDELGWGAPSEAVNRTFLLPSLNAEATVAGVIRDFHFESFRNEIRPLVFGTDSALAQNLSSPYHHILARLVPGRTAEALESLERAWGRFSPDAPFEPVFVSDAMAELYEEDRRFARVLTGFALVALLLALLGVIGLAAYAVEQRRKEIGIRRVLGASGFDIVVRFLREYAVLVTIGAVIATPVAAVLFSRWLEGFPYHFTLGPGLFILAFVAALLLAFVVVGVQVLNAVRVPPTEALQTD